MTTGNRNEGFHDVGDLGLITETFVDDLENRRRKTLLPNVEKLTLGERAGDDGAAQLEIGNRMGSVALSDSISALPN
jgi:hypothetical protein